MVKKQTGNHRRLLRLRRAIDRFGQKKILVVGDVMLDSYLEGPPRSVSAEAPVVVIRTNEKVYKLGGAANTAENLRALGAHAFLTGVIGNIDLHDDAGKLFLQALKKEGISTSGIIHDSTRPTTAKMRIVSQQQQIVRVDEEGIAPISGTVERGVLSYISRTIPHVDAILVSDYNKGVITPSIMKMIMQLSKRYHLPVVVDPRPDHRELYRGVTMVTPNEHELVQMFGRTEIDDDAIIDQARQLQRDLDIQSVMLTRGAKGLDLLDPSGVNHHVAALARQAVDVSGAGDTVASLAVLMVGDMQWPDIAYLTSIGAKVSVSKRRTTAVSRHDLLQELTAR